MQEVYPRVKLIHPAEKTTTGQPYTYLLERPAGNLLLTNFTDDTDISPMFDAIEAAGGISMQLLTDRRGASPLNNTITERFGAPLVCSEVEAVWLRAHGIEVGQAFAFEEHYIADDLEVVPSPGLTPGGTSYLWHSDMSEYLFLGELIYPSVATWRSPDDYDDLDDLIESLELLRDYEFHVMVGSSPLSTEVPVVDLNAGKRWNIFETAIEYLDEF